MDELRLKIAKTQGWTFWSVPGVNHHSWPYDPDTDLDMPIRIGMVEMYRVENPTSVIWGEADPDWTHDIAAAWELVEEMRLAGYLCAVLSLPENFGREGKYEAKVYTPEADYVAIAYEHGETAAEVICRAWLAWKEGNHDH